MERERDIAPEDLPAVEAANDEDDPRDEVIARLNDALERAIDDLDLELAA